MARICRLAADTEKTPYLDFKKDPAIVERMMYNNGNNVAWIQQEKHL